MHSAAAIERGEEPQPVPDHAADWRVDANRVRNLMDVSIEIAQRPRIPVRLFDMVMTLCVQLSWPANQTKLLTNSNSPLNWRDYASQPVTEEQTNTIIHYQFHCQS